jgi:hypothetical protein
MLCRVHCNSLYFHCNVWEKNSVCSGSYGNKKANVMDNVCIQLIEQFECYCLTLKIIGRVILTSDLS